MSNTVPSVSMEMNQQMLVAAITEYVQTNMFGRPVEVVNIDFTAGRKANGHTATIEVAFDNGQSATVEVPSKPIKRTGTRKAVKQEEETNQPAEEEQQTLPEMDNEEDVVDQPTTEDSEEEQEAASTASKKSLFKS